MTDTYPTDIQKLIDDTNTAWEAVTGSDRLWRWFGLGRDAFCVLPRVYMHAMPEEWQEKMARLLEEYDDAHKHPDDAPFDGCRVQVVKRGRMVETPDWLLNYRHPDPIIDTIIRPLSSRSASAVSAGGPSNE